MLEQLLGIEALGFILVFTRMGGVVALAPALGESAIPTNVRLALALLLTIVIYPNARGTFDLNDISTWQLVSLVVMEAVIGLFIGLIGRMALAALHVAGTVIAFQSGLAAAQSFDPSQGSQGALVARFLTLLGVVLIFATGLHHLLIKACMMSYAVFPPGEAIMTGDIAELATSRISAAFALGLQIAAPFLAYGLLFNIALGIIARLMPQLPIFFVAMPANIAIGFMLLMFTISAMMLWFLRGFEEAIIGLLG